MKTSNLNYVGSFSTLQTSGTKSLVDYGTKYSPKQQELYYRLLKGLKIYEPEELYAMNSTKKLRISKAHTKAQQILNLWKQERMIEKSNQLYSTIFQEAQDIVGLEEITKIKIPFSNKVSCRKIIKKPAFSLAGILSALSVEIEPDPEFLCTLSFDDLGITKDDIVMKFKEHKLLPANYDEL
jgi:hypothetical protein